MKNKLIPSGPGALFPSQSQTAALISSAENSNSRADEDEGWSLENSRFEHKALGLFWWEYWLRKKLKTASFTSISLDRICPSTSRQASWFFFYLVVAAKWKNRVFLSPSLHHYILDFWCQVDSWALYRILSREAMVLLLIRSPAARTLHSFWWFIESASSSSSLIL